MSDKEKCDRQTELTETDDPQKRAIQVQKSLEPPSGKEGRASRAWSREISTEKIESEEKVIVAGNKVAEKEVPEKERKVNPNSSLSEKILQHKTEVANRSFQSGWVSRAPTPRPLKQASSTSTIADSLPGEERDPLNVKRVSSSNDVSQVYKPASAQRYRGRMSAPGTAQGAARGGGSGRRKPTDTDGGRPGDGGRMGQQRNSIQDGEIRLPPQRGGKVPHESETGKKVPATPNQKSSLNSVQQSPQERSE